MDLACAAANLTRKRNGEPTLAVPQHDRDKRNELTGVWPDPVRRWADPTTELPPAPAWIGRAFGVLILGAFLSSGLCSSPSPSME